MCNFSGKRKIIRPKRQLIFLRVVCGPPLYLLKTLVSESSVVMQILKGTDPRKGILEQHPGNPLHPPSEKHCHKLHFLLVMLFCPHSIQINKYVILLSDRDCPLAVSQALPWCGPQATRKTHLHMLCHAHALICIRTAGRMALRCDTGGLLGE